MNMLKIINLIRRAPNTKNILDPMFKIKTSIVLIFIFLFFFNAYQDQTIFAQDTGIFRGFVSDSLSGEPLPYANIYIKELNRGTSTDFRGYFLMASLPASKYNVMVSYVGYKTKAAEIEIKSDAVISINVWLSSTNIQMKTIESYGTRINDKIVSDLGLQRIAMHDIENLPKGLELDIFRTLQYIPGVQTTGDVSSRFYVRGSSSNENLVMLDNAVIYNPFHAVGIMGTVDPDVVNSLEFYKSGFPVEYTNRLSSVININSKDGNKNSFGAKAGLSMLTAKVMFEGPIPHGSFILNVRKNYTDAILKKFRNDNYMPADFYDFYAKINYSNDDFMKNSKYSISAYSSGDKILYNDPTKEDFTWNNRFLSFNYFQITDSPLYYQLNIAYSTFQGERIPNLSGGKLMTNEVKDVTANVEFNYVYDNKDSFSGGIKITNIRTDLLLKNYMGLEKNEESDGTSLSAFLKYNMLRFSFFNLEVGSRFHGTKLAGGGSKFFIEPRASITIPIMPILSFKGSWGIFSQDLVTVSDENEVVTIFEPWIITPIYLTPSSAIHYNAGIEYNPSDNISIKLEGYYKTMHDITILSPFRDLTYQNLFFPAKSTAYGLELLTNYKIMNYDVTISYAWMNTTKEYMAGYSFKPRYDSPHNINIIVETALGNDWNASCAWKYSSGTPFKKIDGYYDRLNIDIISDTPFLVDSYIPFMVQSSRFGRLPDYHRLDISVSKKIQINDVRIALDLSVLNVYNRQNVFYFKRETGERVNMLPFLPSVNIKVEL